MAQDSQAGEVSANFAGVHFEVMSGSEQGTGRVEICCYDGSFSEADLESFCDSLEVHYSGWRTCNSIIVDIIDITSMSLTHICHRWHADDYLAECKHPIDLITWPPFLLCL